MASRELALRTRFILVAMCAVVPLVVLSLILVVRAQGAGEALLASQLEDQLAGAAAQVEVRWHDRRSDLLLLGESEPSRRALSAVRLAAEPDTAPAFVRRAFSALPAVQEITVRDRSGALRWHLVRPAGSDAFSAPSAPVIPDLGLPVAVRLPLTDLMSGDTIGQLEARILASAILPDIATAASTIGPMLAVTLPGGRLIAPPGSDPAIFASARATSADRPWLSVRRVVAEPPLVLVAAGALDPFVAPFRRAARTGAALLLLVAAALIALVIAATGRITRGLEQLVSAAEAVTAGDLDRRVEVRSRDEVGRMGAAFNAMTDSLRSTMQTLAEREALAAVGEFAAELAHEIRNPLTSMRLDLQRLDEVGGDRAAARGILERSLRQIARLERAVSGALRVSRGARAEHHPVSLADVLAVAGRAAEPEFSHRNARLRIEPPPGPIMVPGDAAALEQLFVNLFVNAAQASPGGGIARVSTSLADQSACVTVVDDGPGMTADQIERVQRPFHSTKRDGTGLGLAIARRIAAAHGGSLELQSEVGKGTRVLVHLPLAGRTLPADG